MLWVILFLQKLAPGKKLWGASYISERVHPGGHQGCPTVEEAYPKKTCNVNGGMKDNNPTQSVFNQIILNHGYNDFNIEHLLKGKLEQMGQLPDVLDVVEEVMTLNHFNTCTNNPNDEMDKADMETNLTAKEVEENANTNDMNDHLSDEGMEAQTHT